MWRKFTYRLAALACILFILNWVYSQYFYKSDLIEHSDLYPKLTSVPPKTDILYLGESSNITFSSNDLDKRAISDFLGDHYPKLSVVDITQAGAHAGIYYEILAAIADTVQINTVVVTMNYRSFSADWIYSKLERPLRKKTVLLRQTPALYNRFLLSFKGFGGYDEITRKALIHTSWLIPFSDKNLPYPSVKTWDNAIANEGIKNENGAIDWKKTALAAANVKNFAFELNSENVRVKDFDKIAKLAHDKGWNLVFSIMPENLENAKHLVGSELVALMKKNKDYLIDRYEGKKVKVVDNFNDVKHELFIDKDFPTEHYAQKGRRSVANAIAQQIKLWFPKKYVQVTDPKTGKRTYFFHDCERAEKWGQMQTISTEKAYSGNKSSKFGGDQAFSLSLDYPFLHIPQRAKNSLKISLAVFVKEPPKKLQLIIELSGDSTDFSSNAFSVNELSKLKLNEWNLINHQFSIPYEAKDADIIKVYLYNPTRQVTYLDNLEIRFE